MRGHWMIGLPLVLAACGGDASTPKPPLRASAGAAVAVVDTMIVATTEATGLASPMESSTLSTRLMASVVDVLVLEGAKVQQGQVLVRLDLRDLAAKRQQAQAGLADVEAQREFALVSATRLRAMYADSGVGCCRASRRTPPSGRPLSTLGGRQSGPRRSGGRAARRAAA